MLEFKLNDLQSTVGIIKNVLLQRSPLMLMAQQFVIKHLAQQAITYLLYGKKTINVGNISISLVVKKKRFFP
jgi:hypothetical protein